MLGMYNPNAFLQNCENCVDHVDSLFPNTIKDGTGRLLPDARQRLLRLMNSPNVIQNANDKKLLEECLQVLNTQCYKVGNQILALDDKCDLRFSKYKPGFIDKNNNVIAPVCKPVCATKDCNTVKDYKKQMKHAEKVNKRLEKDNIKLNSIRAALNIVSGVANIPPNCELVFVKQSPPKESSFSVLSKHQGNTVNTVLNAAVQFYIQHGYYPVLKCKKEKKEACKSKSKKRSKSKSKSGKRKRKSKSKSKSRSKSKSGGLSDLTVAKLRKLAKKKGVSLSAKTSTKDAILRRLRSKGVKKSKSKSKSR